MGGKMTFKKYQELCGLTDVAEKDKSKYPVPQYIYAALGVAGEAGEVVDEAKKSLRTPENGKPTPERISKMVEEMGDVLWYIAKLCREFGIDMGAVAEFNILKLKKRYEERGQYEASR